MEELMALVREYKGNPRYQRAGQQYICTLRNGPRVGAL